MENECYDHEERLKINALNGFKCAKKIEDISKITLAIASGACTITGIYELISGIKDGNLIACGGSVLLLLLTYFLDKGVVVCHNYSKECQTMIEEITKELTDTKTK